MDAHLFRLFAKTARPFLINARIEKIQEPEPGLLTINLYGNNERRQLNWSYNRKLPFCFFSGEKLTAGRSPSAQIMRFRKYFVDHRIASSVFQFCQRKLWLLASDKALNLHQKSVPWLCLDLVKGPSLHFLDVEAVPREDQPEWPRPAELAGACENWRDWPVLTPSLRKYLSVLEESDRWALMEDLRSGEGYLFLQRNKNGQIIKASAWPLIPEEGEGVEEIAPEDLHAGFEKAGRDLVLRKFHEDSQDRLVAPLRAKRERKIRILKKLEDDEKRLKAMALKERDGQVLRDRLWQYDGESHFREIEAGEDGEKIILNEKYSLLENMERFFHEAKRGKRGLKVLQERKAALLEEIASLENAWSDAPLKEIKTEKPIPPVSRINALRASLPKNVQGFLSTDGHVLLRGKDANGNRSILRLAQGHDLWCHVETGQGAHVLIRRKFPGEEISNETLGEAAALAAIKSWFKDAGSCSVMFAEARHVKPVKNGASGKVTIDKLFLTGIFDIDTEIEKKLMENENNFWL